jgi:hypothetical protein
VIYVAIKHQISDPAAFQERGKKVHENLPAGVRALQFFPKADVSKAEALTTWAEAY